MISLKKLLKHSSHDTAKSSPDSAVSVKGDDEAATSINIFDEGEYYFYLDSDSLDEVPTKLYGYAVTERGILDSSVADKENIGYLDGCGSYVYVDASTEAITIEQDYFGDYGLFLYRDGEFFALSNSFFMLVDRLKKSHQLSLNKDYINQFLVTWIVSLAYSDTPANEIVRLPANSTVRIDKGKRTLDVEILPCHPNEISLRSEEGTRILDRWYKKWTRIVRGLAVGQDNITVDLSGGFDSRLTFLFIVKSGVDKSRFQFNSLTDGLHTHAEDFEIAGDIAKHYGFELNAPNDHAYSVEHFTPEDITSLTFHSKMMFQKELSFPNSRTVGVRYLFGGFGGELLRPYWDMPPAAFFDHQSRSTFAYRNVLARALKQSTERVIEKSFEEIEEKYSIDDPNSGFYSFNMFRDCYSRNHFGRINVEGRICNCLKVSPLLDPELQKLKLSDEGCQDRNLLYALSFVRYCDELLGFKFDSGRSFKDETLEYARTICSEFPFVEEEDLEEEPFVLPLSDSSYKPNTVNPAVSRVSMENLFLDIFQSYGLKAEFASQFDSEIYERALAFSKREKYYPQRHIYSVIGATEMVRAVDYSKMSCAKSRLDVLSSLFDYKRVGWSSVADLSTENTARIDLLMPDKTEQSFEVVSVSDADAIVRMPDWLLKKGYGFIVESAAGSFDVAVRAKLEGKLTVALRSPDRKWPNGQRVNNWITVTRFLSNNEEVIHEVQNVCHDHPVSCEFNVSSGDSVFLHVEWKVDERRSYGI